MKKAKKYIHGDFLQVAWDYYDPSKKRATKEKYKELLPYILEAQKSESGTPGDNPGNVATQAFHSWVHEQQSDHSYEYVCCIEAIRKYIRDNDISVYRFAKNSGINESTLHNYLHYTREATSSNLLRMLKTVGYRIEMKKGEGFSIQII